MFVYSYLARWYDLIAGRWEKNATDSALGMLAPQPGEYILEIGCGTGSSLINISKLIEGNGKAFGVDISKNMLAIAEKKIEKVPEKKSIELSQCSALALPYPEKMFDAIFMSFVLETFSERDADVVLQECRRVLKPSGRICILSLSKTVEQNSIARLYEWVHTQFPSIIDCKPIFLEDILTHNSFTMITKSNNFLFGLPIETVLCK